MDRFDHCLAVFIPAESGVIGDIQRSLQAIRDPQSLHSR